MKDGRAQQHDAASAEPAPAEIDLREILGMLGRRKRLILAIALVGTAAAGAVPLLITPRYTAHAQILLDPQGMHIPGLATVTNVPPQDPAMVQTQAEMIASRLYAEQLVDRLGLATRFALLSEPPGEAPPAAQDAASAAEPGAAWGLGQWLTSASWAAEWTGPAPDRTSEWRRRTAVDVLLDHLRVEADGRLLSVRFTSTDPKEAAVVANALGELFVEDQFRLKAGATQHATDWLKRRVEELHAGLRDAEEAVERFRTETGALALGTNASAEVATLMQQRLTIQSELSQRTAQLEAYRALRLRDDGFAQLGDLPTATTLRFLLQEQAQLTQEQSRLRQQLGENHPTIRQVQAQRAGIARGIQLEADALLRGLESEVGLLRTQTQAVSGRLAQAQDAAAEAERAGIELRELERQAEAARAMYTNFLVRFEETNKQKDLIYPDARVVALAAVPLVPSFPRLGVMFGAGLVGSLILAALAAFLVEHLDRRLRGAQQAERALGITALGSVPRLKRRRRGRDTVLQYLVKKPLSAYAEAVRGVQTTLRLADRAGSSQIVLVTSSLPGEGKTTLAVSLAAVAAMSGLRTVLVELDLRRPALRRELSCTRLVGVAEHLSGLCDLDEAVQRVDALKGLDVLPANKLASDPAKLLSSPKLAELLTRLRGRYDLIVLDTPPLLGLADTKIVARQADQVLFAARWSRTTQQVAMHGLRRLREAQATVLGFVLTQVDINRQARLHYGDAEAYYDSYKSYYGAEA